MNNLIDKLDFLKGKKTVISSFFVMGATLGHLTFNTEINPAEIEQTFWILVDQTEIIVGVLGIVYGIFMKIIRVFR